MTPNEKAHELVGKFIENTKEWSEIDGYVIDKYRAKECALVTVDELIKNTKSMNAYPPNFQIKNSSVKEYWKEVKEEIKRI